METYPDLLNCLYLLLDRCGETSWRDVSIGSFNDLYLCQRNGHKVTRQQEPWVNHLLSALMNLSLAGPLDISERKPEGLHLLQGWRCLDCGYSRVDPLDIEEYLAAVLVTQEALVAFKQSRLESFVKDVIDLRLPQLEFQRARIRKMLEESDISVREIVGYLRPCPACQSQNTAVYRWRENKEKGTPFIPADNNPPLAQEPPHSPA